MKPVINIGEIQSHGERFEARLGTMARRIGAERLGCRLTVVPPGKRAWPFHNHHANEEMFFILEGDGTYRLGDEHFPITAGDLISALAGGVDRARQLVNDSDQPLKYLALSTMLEPDVMEYPDSNKFGVFAGAAPGGDREKRTFSAFAPSAQVTGYWDGED